MQPSALLHFFCQVASEFSSVKAGYKAHELALFAEGEVPHLCCYLTHVPTFLGQRLARPAAGITLSPPGVLGTSTKVQMMTFHQTLHF